MLRRAIVFLLFTLVAVQPIWAFAESYYIRANATGSNNGSNWANAWNDWPTTLQRGNTYFVADGEYSGKLFNTPESGNSYITVKKATLGDHGTEVGWVNSYGAAQAIMKPINFITSYWIFDGSVGSGGDPSSYGFRIMPNGPCESLGRSNLIGVAGLGYSRFKVTYVTIKHVAAVNCGASFDIQQTGIYSAPRDESYRAENIIIANNYFSDSSSNMLIRVWSNSIIEDNYFAGNWSSANNHGQQISPGSKCNNIILRNNTFKNSLVFIIGTHKDYNYGWKIYSNLVVGGQLSAGWANADSSSSDVMLNWEIYNNTHQNVAFGGRGAVFVGTVSDVINSQTLVYNNLFTSCSSPILSNADGTPGAIKHYSNTFTNCTGVIPQEENPVSMPGRLRMIE